MATLALAAGVPMLSHGDELDRSQQGNNNAYCQDSPLTWVHWDLDEGGENLGESIADLLSLRRELRLGVSDAGAWLAADAGPLSAVERHRSRPQPFGWLRQHDRCQSLTIFNGDTQGHLFELPDLGDGHSWRLLFNTSTSGSRLLRGRAVRVPPRSLLFLRSEGRAAAD